MSAADVLAGRRERALLAWPSVRRMAELLAGRCREPSWVRTSVASLDRFRTLTGHHDLEALLERARTEPAAAERALGAFASALAGATASQVAGLAMGPKNLVPSERRHGAMAALAWRACAITFDGR